MSPSVALVYAGTVAWGVLLAVGIVGALCVTGELLFRIGQAHRRGLARVRRAAQL